MNKGQYAGLISGDANGLVNGLKRGLAFGLVKNQNRLKAYHDYLISNRVQNEPLDIDYVFVLSIGTSKGYSLPTADGQISGSRFIKRLKRDGVWTTLDVVYPYAGSGDSGFATLNWKAPQRYQSTLVNSPTYTTNQGFTGNGTNSYINTGFDLNTHSDWALQNSNCWAIGINTNPAGASMQDFGSRKSSPTATTTAFYSRLATDTLSSRNNSAISDAATGANTNSIGDYVGVRTSSTSMSVYKDAVLVGTDSSATSVGLPNNQNAYVLASNFQGVLTEPSSRQVTHLAWGNFGNLISEWNAAWKEYFTSLGVSQTQPTESVYNNLSWNRYVQPVINAGKASTAGTYTQCSHRSTIDDGKFWYTYILGSAFAIESDRDRIFLATKRKDNDVRTGWAMAGGSSSPTVILDVGSAGQFDESQIMPACALFDNGIYKLWYVAHDAGGVFKTGLATSRDGTTYTKYSGNPIFQDATIGAGVGVTNMRVVRNNKLNRLEFLCGGNDLGENVTLAVSYDGGYTITKIKTITAFANRGLGWPIGFMLIDDVYYVWFAYSLRFFSNISEYFRAYSTKDFDNITDLGIQMQYRGGMEYGITNSIDFLRKPNGTWFMMHTSYKNQIYKTANHGEEGTCIKVAELATTNRVPISSPNTTFSFPSNLIRHYPLSPMSFDGTNFIESINGDLCTINSAPVFASTVSFGHRGMDMLQPNGTQTITCPAINTAGIDWSNFGVKIRISMPLTLTRELFRIGNDIIVSLEAGNLQVVLSADGVAETKKYITTADVAEPTGIDYMDNHIYVGFVWTGGVLTLYGQDFMSSTVTKTNDGALTTVNNSGSTPLIAQNASIDIALISVLSPCTNQEWIDLEI